ncbi:hypothetical protein [Streptomyces pseudovenezuelae]|nr:hypothetical protein [Streptomyces pseudovenezuelae]
MSEKPVEEPYVSGGDADGVHRQYHVKVPQGRVTDDRTVPARCWVPR